MTIFFNNIKRILRDKANLIPMFLLPLMFIVFVMLLSHTGRIRVGIVDNDGTEFTKYIKDKLSQKCTIIYLKNDEATKELIDSKIDYAVVIDKGFTKDIIDGKDSRLKTLKIKETNISASTKLYIENIINSSKNIAKVSKGNSNDFYSILKKYDGGIFTAKYSTLGNSKMGGTYASIGFIVLSMLLFSGNATQMIIADKENKTFFRILTSPISLFKYMLQNILSYLILSILQVYGLFLIIIYGFKGDFGAAPFNTFLLFIAFSLVAVSLGVLIASISKNQRQSSLIISFLTIPMCMLGGCFWSYDIMPNSLQKIANFVPTTWVMKGANKAFLDSSFTSILPYILVLLLFSVVFFLLGAFKKEDIAK